MLTFTEEDLKIGIGSNKIVSILKEAQHRVEHVAHYDYSITGHKDNIKIVDENNQFESIIKYLEEGHLKIGLHCTFYDRKNNCLWIRFTDEYQKIEISLYNIPENEIDRFSEKYNVAFPKSI